MTLLIKFIFAKFKLLAGNPVYKLGPNGRMTVQIPYFSPIVKGSDPVSFEITQKKQDQKVKFSVNPAENNNPLEKAITEAILFLFRSFAGIEFPISDGKAANHSKQGIKFPFFQQLLMISNHQNLEKGKAADLSKVHPEWEKDRDLFLSSVGKVQLFKNKTLGKEKVLDVEVRLIRIHYPYLDSTILAHYIALNAGKYNFNRLQKMLFKCISFSMLSFKNDNKGKLNFSSSKLPFSDQLKSKNLSENLKKKTSGQSESKRSEFWGLNLEMGQFFEKQDADQQLLSTVLPSQITGMKLELAGRLTTQRSIPRKTVENKHIGSLTKQSSYINLSQYASKNKIGAYTIKVWLGSD